MALTTKEAGIGAKVGLNVAAADGGRELHDEGDAAEHERTRPRIHLVPHPPPSAGALLSAATREQ